MSNADKFATECLDAHNEKRKKHGVSKLKMNSELCKLATSWAQTLLRGSELKNSKNTYKGEPVGENIAGKTSTAAHVQYSGAEVVDQWYAEHKDYDYKTPGSTGLKTGHFSQIVWKGSMEFGVGMASSNGKCIVVAHYFPAGNVIGRHKDNVFAPSTTAKLKSLLSGKKKERRDSSSSSSSSSDDEGKTVFTQGSKKVVTTSKPSASTTTSKVTITKTIRKPDGTVETITEERTETHNNNNDDSLHKRFHNATTITDPGHRSKAVSSPTQSNKEFQQDALAAHNKYRSKHRAGPLKLNGDLCVVAQKWADHLSSISSLQHSTNKHKGEPLGENIASKWGSAGADYTGSEVVEQWYSEEPCYDYSGRSNAGKSGHFTQVVWKGSTELGIGKSKDSKGRVYVVANYYPAGNFISRFAENVDRAK